MVGHAHGLRGLASLEGACRVRGCYRRVCGRRQLRKASDVAGAEYVCVWGGGWVGGVTAERQRDERKHWACGERG